MDFLAARVYGIAFEMVFMCPREMLLVIKIIQCDIYLPKEKEV